MDIQTLSMAVVEVVALWYTGSLTCLISLVKRNIDNSQYSWKQESELVTRLVLYDTNVSEIYHRVKYYY